jgi:hypothetical protein
MAPYSRCIKRRADALANLPNLGKVVFPPGRCGHFGNETGRANVSPPLGNRWRNFHGDAQIQQHHFRRGNFGWCALVGGGRLCPRRRRMDGRAARLCHAASAAGRSNSDSRGFIHVPKPAPGPTARNDSHDRRQRCQMPPSGLSSRCVVAEPRYRLEVGQMARWRSWLASGWHGIAGLPSRAIAK